MRDGASKTMRREDMDLSTVAVTRTREPAAQPGLDALKARQRAA
jgi:hypothetical protein